MTLLIALCGVCGEAIDSTTVEAHMDAHGLVTPADWKLAAWPDGTSVVIDPDETSTP